MNQMCVKNKDDNETYEVYDITYDNKGCPHFLIYKDNQWLCMSAKHFRPLNVKDFNALIEKWSSPIAAY